MSEDKFIVLMLTNSGFSGYPPVVKTETGSISSHTSGYGDPDLSKVEDGCIVISTREAYNRDDFVKNVLRAPLLDVSLKGNEISWCPKPSDLLSEGVSGAFKDFLNHHEAVKQKGIPGPLDAVSPQYLANWWKQRGGKSGKVKDGKIEWDD